MAYPLSGHNAHVMLDDLRTVVEPSLRRNDRVATRSVKRLSNIWIGFVRQKILISNFLRINLISPQYTSFKFSVFLHRDILISRPRDVTNVDCCYGNTYINYHELEALPLAAAFWVTKSENFIRSQLICDKLITSLGSVNFKSSVTNRLRARDLRTRDFLFM